MSISTSSLLKKVSTLIIIIAIITGSYFFYLSYPPPNSKPVMSKVYYEASKGDIRTSISAVGTIYSADARNISAPDASVVASINCKEGQVVKKGDMLFKLRNDAAELDLKKAKLNLSLLQNQLNIYNNQKDDLSVYSPVEGVIKKINIGLRDKINTDQIVVQIEEKSDMTFTVSIGGIPSSSRPYFDNLSVDDIVQISISDYTGTRNAKVLSIAAAGQGNSITFQVMDAAGLTWGEYYGVTFWFSKEIQLNDKIQLDPATVRLLPSNIISFVSSFKITPGKIAPSERAFLNSLVLNDIVPVSISGVKGVRNAKVTSVTGTSEGNNITFQLLDSSDVTWGNVHDITFKLSKQIALNNKVPFTGNILNVKARSSGTVSLIHVKTGDSVAKEQKIIEASNNTLDNQIQMAQINLEVAQLDVNNKQKIVDNLTVLAPVDGMVFNIQVKPGDLIGALSSTVRNAGTSSNSSANLLAMMENRLSLQVWVPVDELDISKIKIGQDVQIAVDAYKDKVYKGKISAISPKGTVQNGSAVFQVEIDVEKPEGLKTGMTANVSIITSARNNTVLIPVDAVQTDKRGKKFVYVKNADSSSLREVEIGLTNAENAEIISGLKEGERVEVQFESIKDVEKPKFLGLGGQGTPPQIKIPVKK